MALLINPCDDLESPFIRYISDQIGKPVWGVGPLLPEQYWKSAAAGSLLHDRELRTNNRKSNVTEDEVIQWLDSKPRGSVLCGSFGSEVGPTMEEYPRLADALLESSSTLFIWVPQHGFPTSSVTALDAFRDFINHKAAEYNRDEVDLESGTRNSSNMGLFSVFIAITVQSTSTIFALSLDWLSPVAKKLFTGVLVTNLVGFLCLYVALFPSRYISRKTAKILGKVGGAAAAFGVILMMGIKLPLWIIIPASVVVLAASVSSVITQH